MQFSRWKISLSLGLILMTVAGCYSHYPYSPYGSSGYPGVYSSPPAGTFPQQNGSLGAPGAFPQGFVQPSAAAPRTFGSAAAGGARQPLTKSAAGNAPAFDSRANEFGGADSGGAVPLPRDAGDFNQPFPGENGIDFNEVDEDPDAATPFSDDGQAGVELQGIDDSGPELTQRSPDTDSEDIFQPPYRVDAASSSRRLIETSEKAVTDAPNPYDFDRKNYHWLRGVVDHDKRDGTWYVIYDIKPDKNDRYGGGITLMDDPRLDSLHNGDVVYVEGRIDADSKDSFGKPQYRIEKIARLEAKKTPGTEGATEIQSRVSTENAEQVARSQMP